jgi:Mrp family chromosome partitioning ATPase
MIFDTAPSQQIADSSVLAAAARAKVILLLEAGRTTRTAALKARDQFAYIGSDIIGIILNKVDPNKV